MIVEIGYNAKLMEETNTSQLTGVKIVRPKLPNISFTDGVSGSSGQSEIEFDSDSDSLMSCYDSDDDTDEDIETDSDME